MQTTSALYNTILADEYHWFESKLVIDGVGTYGETQLFAMSTSTQMFQDAPTIGKAVAQEIDVKMLLPSVDIPVMAKLMPYTRVCNATQQSEWLPQGVFYIDTRERTKNNDGLDVLTIHGYDAMLKAEQMYNGRITGDSTDIQMVDEIAYQMGVSVDARTTAMMTNAYTIPLPTGYTYREVLGYIASMYVGCFIMTEEGKLRLVSLLELPPETNYLIDQVGDVITFGSGEVEEHTVSGAIASFTTDDRPLADCTCTINPVQDLHGYANPWPAGGGKNLCPKFTTATNNGVTFTVQDDGSVKLSNTATAAATLSVNIENTIVEKLRGQTVTFSGYSTAQIHCQLRIGVGSSYTYPTSSNGAKTVSIPADCDSLRFDIRVTNGTNANGVTVYPQLERGSIVTAFEPYSNICPITGHTGLKVYDEAEYDPTATPKVTVSWQSAAGTVYGGTLDVTTGELTVTHQVAVFDGDEAWGVYASSEATMVSVSGANYPVPGYDATPQIVCDSFSPATRRSIATNAVNGVGILNATTIIFYYEGASTVAEWKSYLSENPVTVLYPLATPLTYQLTPTEITTLIGQNNVWHGANGNISVTYETGGEATRILV